MEEIRSAAFADAQRVCEVEFPVKSRRKAINSDKVARGRRIYIYTFIYYPRGYPVDAIKIRSGIW